MGVVAVAVVQKICWFPWTCMKYLFLFVMFKMENCETVVGRPKNKKCRHYHDRILRNCANRQSILVCVNQIGSRVVGIGKVSWFVWLRSVRAFGISKASWFVWLRLKTVLCAECAHMKYKCRSGSVWSRNLCRRKLDKGAQMRCALNIPEDG